MIDATINEDVKTPREVQIDLRHSKRRPTIILDILVILRGFRFSETFFNYTRILLSLRGREKEREREREPGM